MQRYNAGKSVIMNSSVGSLGNGKRIFLAAGKDADCYIYQVKLRPRDKEAGISRKIDYNGLIFKALNNFIVYIY